MNMQQFLESESNERIVAILGLGYVGLPLALLFVRKGFRVIGIDPNAGKIDELHKGRSYIHEIGHEEVKAALQTLRFLPTSQHSAIQAAEAVIICVPTPLTAYGTPDLSYLTEVAAQIGDLVKPGQLIVLESSTYPGTTREVLQPLLERSGLKAGRDIHVAYSPERVDPGNKQFPLERIPKIVSGATPVCLERVTELYCEVFPEIHPVTTTDAAEMAKILENAYRLVNISFVNELAVICDKLELDLWEVIEAANTKPFGFKAFYPGPGIGGHCIPVDPSYLQWKIKQFDMSSEFIGMSSAVNHRMPMYIVQQLKAAISPKEMAGANILVYGAAYKPDIADYRESASIDLIELLRLEGVNVYYHDPYIPKLALRDATLTHSELSEQMLRGMDVVVIATNHSAMPLDMLLQHASIIYDSRNVTKGKNGNAKVIRLGAANSHGKK
ncbi:nucleotide sugar dehydrogenase [Paenibacillus sp. HB172176]|uniref:nucleotide sugar dehydrogenase n=1 Tax=Paenibacillus sp. HB172176 TaxID=2493690 RepID=UPI001F0D13EE|nr:nucleotide sugar dehydrogenase [Paenibacillus sp. HB172176]